jgi:AraC-like DNA-binding protein
LEGEADGPQNQLNQDVIARRRGLDKTANVAKLVKPCGFFLGSLLMSETPRSAGCGFDVTHVWEREGGFSVRRLVRNRGIAPIPRNLPGYRAAFSVGQNQAWLAVGKRVVTAGSFTPGTKVLGQPGDAFDGEMRDRVDMMLFLMEPRYVAAQFENLGLPGNRAELQDLPARPDPGLLDLGCRLVDALGHGLSGDELYCEVLLEAMLTRIIIRHATVTFGRMPYREILTPAKLRKLVAFIDQNLSSPLRLGELAAAAALSQAHLARSFRNATGIPLHRYVLQRRLERARSLLSHADVRVQTVAAQCGFADAPHLSKAYRKAYGITPASTSD